MNARGYPTCALSNRIRALRNHAALQASVSAIGWSVEDVLEIFSDRQRWYAVESELRTFLNGVSSANLVRRHQLELIAGHAYAIAARLARDPANSNLIPFVEEMQRLRKLERRRKPATRAEPEVPRSRRKSRKRTFSAARDASAVRTSAAARIR